MQHCSLKIDLRLFLESLFKCVISEDEMLFNVSASGIM